MEGTRDAREVGRATVDAVRLALARRLGEREQPAPVPLTVGAGLAPRRGAASSGGSPLDPSPTGVWRRYIEREIEQQASLLRELSVSALRALGAAPQDAGEEPTATTEVAVVFTDLAGFTAFNAGHGDDAAIALLERVAAFVDPIVAGHDGRVVMRLGDGQLLTFPDADAAVLSALELVEAAPPPLRMRAGAHWGTPVLTSHDVIGHDVNVAARVTDAARPGQVLVTDALRQAATDLPGVRFGRPWPRRMKGIAGRVGVCRVRRDHRGPPGGPPAR